MVDRKDRAKKETVKKPQTLRERASRAGAEKQPRRLKQAGTNALRPLKALARTGRKEVYLPMPDTRAGRFLNKRRSLMPRYFKQAWQEVKQVKWPGRRETAKLTLAVFIFAIFFGLLISLVDYGLDRLFKDLILK